MEDLAADRRTTARSLGPTPTRRAADAIAPPSSLEWPTLCVAVAIYVGWLLATFYHARLSWWLLALVGGLLIAWHGSLQHETIHGHPRGARGLATALGFPPLALWLPYALYRHTHLRHHGTAAHTHPLFDPESYYVPSATWNRLGPLARAWRVAYQTLAGRMLFGPLVVVTALWREEGRQLVRGDARRARMWSAHAAAVAVVLAWVVGVCGMPLWQYVLTFVYPGIALTLLRSFAEHRAPEEVGTEPQTAVVEAGWLLSLVFLHNNLHEVHHRHPRLPWYQLPGVYRSDNAPAVSPGGGPVFRGGYAEVAWRFLLCPIAHPAHPEA